ncbi:hypothetical protein HEL23_008310 [Escherichia coli]|nr:hypothetical protein [Escherichia coli]MBB8069218.1 hypothetical protein [Escherichia coli]
MNNKFIYPLITLFFFSSTLYAKSNLQINGNTLYHGYQLYERGFDYLNVKDEETAVMYMSFVAGVGVGGTLSAEHIICNANITIGQEADIVGNYLQIHPKERTQYTPSELAIFALGKELSCNKNS